MIKSIDLDFTNLEIYDGYVIGRTKEGIELSVDKHIKSLDIVKQYIMPPFGIILDEVNSYSVDFAVIQHLRDDPDVICMGIVYYRLATKIALSIGTSFINKPTKFSSSYENIESWMQEQISTNC